MSEYTLTAGTLSSFEFLYDPKLDRLRDYPTVVVTAKALPDSKFADYRRDSRKECDFLGALLTSAAQGSRLLGGFLDVRSGRATQLDQSLRRSPLTSSSLKYGLSEDLLVLFELRKLPDDFAQIRSCYPPSHGHAFFYSTTQVFEVYDIFWRRKTAGSEQPIRHILAEVENSKLLVMVDPEGTFVAVANPKSLDEVAMQRLVLDAGRRAGVPIVAAPSLFG
jgi:hypothetical protein